MKHFPSGSCCNGDAPTNVFPNESATFGGLLLAFKLIFTTGPTMYGQSMTRMWMWRPGPGLEMEMELEMGWDPMLVDDVSIGQCTLKILNLKNKYFYSISRRVCLFIFISFDVDTVFLRLWHWLGPFLLSSQPPPFCVVVSFRCFSLQVAFCGKVFISLRFGRIFCRYWLFGLSRKRCRIVTIKLDGQKMCGKLFQKTLVHIRTWVGKSIGIFSKV